MKNKLIAAILLLSACLLSSCQGAAENPQNTGGEASGETQTETEIIETVSPYADELPAGLDFGGLEVRFYSREHFRFNDEITVDELNGDVVNDAIYNREQTVEDRLGVSIANTKEGASHGSVDKMKSLVLAGDDAYDIFTASMYTTAPAASSGIFLNLYDVAYIDSSKPYYTQSYIEKSRMGENLYTITGDISLSLIRYSFAVIFNKNLLESYGVDSPYSSVLDGSWTHEKLKATVAGIYSDINGNGVPDDGDIYGLGTSNVIIVDAYCSSYDLHMMDNGEDGYPYFNIDLEKMANAVNMIYDLNFNTDGVRVYREISDNNEMTDLTDYFAQDHLLFINNWIYGTETQFLRDMESDYGIIPYPKYDENQENYYTFQHDQIGVFAIPITTKIADAAGAVLEAMSSESSKTVVPAYYDIALKGKYTRDEESAAMIDIIHNGHLLDPAWIYCSYIGDLAQTPRNLMLKGSSDFMSYYAKNESVYDNNLQKLIDDFSALESNNQVK